MKKMKYNTTRVNKNNYRRTVSKELLDLWQGMRLIGDTQLIADQTGFTKQTIDKVLKYGYAPNPKVLEGVTEFYNRRAEYNASLIEEITRNN